MARAAIALGSNLAGAAASREANLQAAVAALSEFCDVVAVSRWVETDPVGTVAQPRFMNGAALLETDLGAVDLLEALLAIEQRFGRDRSHGIPKGPRTLDLDLLLWGEQVVKTERLTLPHPLMHLRRFVLEPLAEIAPELPHPVLRCTIRQLLERL